MSASLTNKVGKYHNKYVIYFDYYNTSTLETKEEDNKDEQLSCRWVEIKDFLSTGGRRNNVELDSILTDNKAIQAFKNDNFPQYLFSRCTSFEGKDIHITKSYETQARITTRKGLIFFQRDIPHGNLMLNNVLVLKIRDADTNDPWTIEQIVDVQQSILAAFKEFMEGNYVISELVESFSYTPKNWVEPKTNGVTEQEVYKFIAKYPLLDANFCKQCHETGRITSNGAFRNICKKCRETSEYKYLSTECIVCHKFCSEMSESDPYKCRSCVYLYNQHFGQRPSNITWLDIIGLSDSVTELRKKVRELEETNKMLRHSILFSR